MLEISDIHGGYGDTEVLHGVSIAVPSASVVALLGANGAGKSTLLRTTSGLLRPRSGTILLNGTDVIRKRPYERVELGLCHLPEGRAIFPNLSVQENLLVQSLKGKEAEGMERAINAFPILGRRLRQRAGTLSGGEQQMLALSRVYMTRPQLVLVDEVSLGLAPILVDSIYGFLKQLAEQGTALLIVEQFVQRVLAIAGFVYILHHGRVAWSGVPSDLTDEALLSTYLGSEAVV